MLDRVAVPYRERVVVPAGLRVSDQERAVLVLRQQQLLLRLHPLDLAEVPSEKETSVSPTEGEIRTQHLL